MQLLQWYIIILFLYYYFLFLINFLKKGAALIVVKKRERSKLKKRLSQGSLRGKTTEMDSLGTIKCFLFTYIIFNIFYTNKVNSSIPMNKSTTNNASSLYSSNESENLLYNE